ncbi:hypothetical protein PFICI_05126 [Pestalotiopsis fici W106-1]|uniref:Uncharacterized protein n=1 Tax=Pestalotiopsis fici (strain W106-1 / CGMCC3.15140) TaxID=1229662 RepID=W3XB42_PESFW|nr:uncharacterized protein PFICI_05126 [Pestalotiopsis fici W106-1]ETS83250.1 hypothetical protein PFICI_05126 [Pestalotiopsis fici W106-1]
MKISQKSLIAKTAPRFIHRILLPRELDTIKAKSVLSCVLNKDVNKDSLPAPGPDSPNDANQPPLGQDKGRKKRDQRDPAILKAAQFMAGRFAAKEAVIKAFHHERLNFGNIEIRNNASPRRLSKTVYRLAPAADSDQATVQANAQKAEPKEQEIDLNLGSGPPVAFIWLSGAQEPLVASVSISHDGDYASATCIYMRPET